MLLMSDNVSSLDMETFGTTSLYLVGNCVTAKLLTLPPLAMFVGLYQQISCIVSVYGQTDIT